MLLRCDMPLAQFGEGGSAPADTAADLITAYWDAIESRVAGQRELVAQVRAEVLGASGSATGFVVAEREVAEQLVLTVQQHLVVAGLSDFISSAARRLNMSAQAYGGRTAPLFVVYHGEVNEESDGPVEVCVPIDSGRQVSPDIATRREPAHREAYVRLRKEQVVFPQILTAYDTVHRWTHEQDRSITAAPREVYFADFLAAEPTDEVCDVAFPIR
jgi:hypothetical protein